MSNKVKGRVFRVAKRFAKRGPTKGNIQTYQKLDKQINELAKGASSKVGRKRFEYMHNPDMTLCGRMLLVYTMMLDCRSRKPTNDSAGKENSNTWCRFD